MCKNFIVLILGLICFGFSADAQTKSVVVESKDTNLKEKYYVLKSDNTIKQGEYAAYSLFWGGLLFEGFYDHNKKDSLWKYYGFGQKLGESGYYKDDNKTGVWTAYDYDGQLQVKYDFTNQKLIFYKPSEKDTAKMFYVINGTDTVKKLLEQPPIYLDGGARFSRTLVSQLKYPAVARENNVSGKVIIAFTVDKDGKLSNYRVKQSLGSGCDEQALNAVEQIPGDWLPGVLNGKPVITEYEVPVNFTLGN